MRFKLKGEFYRIKLTDDSMILALGDVEYKIAHYKNEFTISPNNSGFIKVGDKYRHLMITNSKLDNMWKLSVYVDGIEVYQFRYR